MAKIDPLTFKAEDPKPRLLSSLGNVTLDSSANASTNAAKRSSESLPSPPLIGRLRTFGLAKTGRHWPAKVRSEPIDGGCVLGHTLYRSERVAGAWDVGRTGAA